MQETELLLSLAEIAGVFLGFGALISVRSASTGEAFELTYIREVVGAGSLVVIAALVPVTLSHPSDTSPRRPCGPFGSRRVRGCGVPSGVDG